MTNEIPLGFTTEIKKAFNFLTAFISGNPVSTVILAPAIASVFMKVAEVGFQFVKRNFLVSQITIDPKDDSYQWIVEWIRANPQLNHENHISFTNKGVGSTYGFTPTFGTLYLTYKTHVIWISYSSDLKLGKSKSNAPMVMFASDLDGPPIQIATWGTSVTLLKELVAEARVEFNNKHTGHTKIYLPSNCMWELSTTRKKRDPSTVILETGLFDMILKDTHGFLGKHERYRKNGIPFKRGYMLYGPPGTGKTSTILAIAGALDMSICTVNLTMDNIDDTWLCKLLLNAPMDAILLFEDIDHAFTIERPKITLAGLLNAIDGIAAQEGRLMFMTTNNIEALDKALIRPGRVDVSMKMY